MNYRHVIKEYFKSWINKNPKIIEEKFNDNIIYTECYGPIYNGREQCLNWFSDWNKKGSVLKWDIYNIFQDKGIFIVEWFFECDYENNIDSFDGVSIIEFKDDKISSIKEFQSKRHHYYPYEDKHFTA